MPKSTLCPSVSLLLNSILTNRSGSLKKSSQTFRSFLLFLAVLIASSGQILQAQFSSGCTNCVAQDIKVEDVILKGYPPSSCKEFGYPIPSDTLSILFNVTASERYGLLFVANLVVDDTFRTVISHCFERTLFQGYQTLDIKISEHSLLNEDSLSKLLVAGRKIRLTNVFLGWDNNKNANPPFTAAYVACSAYNPVTNSVDCQKVQGNGAAPKCKYYLEAIGVRAPAKPELTLDSTRNVNCFGDSTGAIYTSVTPATQYFPYQYQWKRGVTAYPATSADITGIPAGTYSVIVKMDGCSDTLQNIIITQPASAVNATAQVINNVKCYGETTGKAYVTGSGGTPFTLGSPYKYYWMPGGQTTDTAYDLAGGTYTVTVEDSLGCKITKTVTISTPTALSATMDSTNICFSGAKGSATITVTGGTPKSGAQKYTYSWNTTPIQTTATASNLDSGTYTVTVTDSMGCTLTRSVRIRQPVNFLSSTTTQKNVNCKGDSTGWAKVIVSGGLKPAKGFIYSWNTVPPKTTDSIFRLKAGTYIVTVKDSLNCTILDTVTITEPANALAATATVAAQVKCFGGATGKAYVTASGGTQKSGAKKYTYSWNTSPLQTTDTAFGLTAGTYTVTVTDSLGCTIQKSITITQPASALTADTSKTNDCKLDTSGTATVTVQGGTPYKSGASYRYSWNTTPVQTTATATKLAAGTYTVTITDSLGCTLQRSITILKPATPLRADTSKMPVKCYGGSTGSATVTVSGGKSPYQYSWNTNPVQTNATATHLAAGTYTVTITDALKCSIQKSITVIQAPSPLTADTSKTNVKCYGDSTGSATVTVSGGLPRANGYVYRWNTTPVQTTATATKLTAGKYTVTITDSLGCEIHRSITVSQPSNGMKADTSKVHVKCFGDSSGSASVSVSGGTPPYKYSWNTTPVQTTATASNLKAGKYTVTITDSTGCSLVRNITVSQPVAPLSADTSKKNVCFGDSTGSATVTVSGGTAPYRYSWNTSPVQTTATATNLKAGTYTVTVSDTAGCTLVRSITITQGNSALKADSSVTNVKCFGDTTGSATVNVSGGMTPYKYQWNTSPVQSTATATKLKAGIYTVTITDSMGCTLVKSVIVRQPDSALTATINKTDIKCNEDSTGTATVSVKGGTGPYRYSWNTTPVQTTATATKLVTGTYTVTVTDSLGCVLTKSVTITKTSNLSIDTSKVNVKCFGDSSGSATVVVTGGKSPYTYHWNTTPVQTTATATKLAAGLYTVTVTDSSGCSSQKSITITQPAAPLTANTTRTNICTADGKGTATVTPSGGTPKATGYLYSWNTTPIQTTATATNLGAGAYTVTVTDSLGCTVQKTVSILKAGAVLSATIDSTNVACYGQSTGSATANPSGGIPPYSYSWNTTPVKTTASITNLAAGSYRVTITDSIGCTYQKTVIITQPAAALNATAQASKASICRGDTSVIKVTASGGTAPYYYKLGAGSYQKSIDSFIVTEPNTYTITVKDSLNCTKTVNITVADKGCNNFCTYSQGYFGTDNNGQASYNNGDGCKKTATRSTIQASLSWWNSKGMDLKVGNINVSGLSDPVQAIINYLPGGGPSTAYTGSTLDGNTPKNTLLAQTLTLGLNIGLNQNLGSYKISNGSIIVQRNNGSCGTGSPLAGECKTFTVDPYFNGKTVKEIFDAAGAALVSGTPEQRNKYASLVSTLNEAFNGCGQAVSACTSPGIVNNWINTEGLETPQATLQVSTYPNPITDHVYIQFVSPVSGDAILEVYDFTGRRLKLINKSNVIANQDNLIKYMIPKVRHSQLVYRITVGKYSARGILLSPPQQ